MGCALKWNPQEHTWDCPCHGSRFEQDGTLIDNPAKKTQNIGNCLKLPPKRTDNGCIIYAVIFLCAAIDKCVYSVYTVYIIYEQ